MKNIGHTKKIYFILNVSIQCKLQNGSLWSVRHLSVTTQTRLLRQRSVSVALNQDQEAPAPKTFIFPLCIFLKISPRL